MVKSPLAAVPLPPQIVSARTTSHDILGNIRVVDVATGGTIANVIDADAETGKLSRFDVDEDGNLIREKDSVKVVCEDRGIRIEWIEAPVPVEAPAGVDLAQSDGDAA